MKDFRAQNVRSEHGSPPAQGLRVLVADDRMDDLQMLTMMLREAGHEVMGVASGSAAREAAREFRPDAVLLDIVMPDESGWELARAMRRQFGDNVLLIAITAYGGQTDKMLSRLAGFDHHLVKPADPQLLFSLLAQGEGARTALAASGMAPCLFFWQTLLDPSCSCTSKKESLKS